jgi:LacI family transcriptional regulator
MFAPKRVLVAFHIPEALRDVLSGVTAYAREQRQNWQILCVNPGEFSANFAGHRCDGAIVQTRIEERSFYQRLCRSKTPVVNLLRNLTPRIPSVLSDDREIGRNGANYLRSLGFRRMAFVALETPWSRGRLEGFSHALRDAGLPPPETPELLGVKDFRFLSKLRGLKLLGRWARTLGPGVAIMAPSDFVARTMLSACQEAGIEVPKDVAILGVDNFPNLCDLWPVPLSSIAQDFSRMGFEAARLLHESMQRNRDGAAQPVLVPPGRLHVRQSTNVVAFEDSLVADAMRLIHEHATAGIGVGELLKRVPLSRRWLDQRFNQAVGHTPAEEMRRCRVRLARDLLMETNLPLRQISARCHFSFPENLIRSFKAAYGMSPTEYRSRHRQV